MAMRILLTVIGWIALLLGIFTIATMPKDPRFTIGLVLFFSGLILLAQARILLLLDNRGKVTLPPPPQ
jgi:hypothetical protein